MTDDSTSQTTNTHYLDGFQYTEDHLDFFPHAEGYVNVLDFSEFNYVYTHKDHLGNIRLKYTRDPGTGETEILEENHYYPFGLTHKGYNGAHFIFWQAPGTGIQLVPVTSLAGDKYKYKFNGMEYQDELDLNYYDFGARNYDPALGRFMVIDPMADFVNYQSPYVMANNNPVLYIDEYGMGILRVIGNVFSRIAFGVKKLFSGNNCDCRRFQGESLGDALRQPDFPDRENERSNRTKKPKNNKSDSKKDNEKKREKVNSVGFLDFQRPSMSTLKLYFPLSQTPIPEHKGKPILTKLSFNEDIKYSASTSNFKDTNLTEKTLSDLIKTLKEYPQLKVQILGNISTSQTGVNQNTPTFVNGKAGTVRDLQLERARAVERFLINSGIDWRRITVGQGRIHTGGGANNMNATFILKNQ